MNFNGIDVSKWNGNVGWKKVKTQKATENTKN